jgi:hypothetical protein
MESEWSSTWMFLINVIPIILILFGSGLPFLLAFFLFRYLDRITKALEKIADQ